MPTTKVTTKGNKDTAIQVTMPNTFSKDGSILSEEVYNNNTTTPVVTKVTLTGQMVGFDSPLVIEITDGDITVEVEYQ